MHPVDLSPEQARVLEPDIRVVEAGPGAGKTRALVARYLQSVEVAKRGVALLSFTNAAVDEARRRTQGRVALLQAPNFVGTIDAFLHRFIVTPNTVPQLGKLPSYLRSWDDLPQKLRSVRLNDVPGIGVRLSHFRVDETSAVTVDLDNLPSDQLAYWNKVAGEGAAQKLKDVAKLRILALCKTGVLDATAARVAAFAAVHGSGGGLIVERIARRFEEILVDEAQDCDGPEFSILELLGSTTRVVVVADPDQAIYEFRGSVPKLFLDHRDAQLPSARCALSTNFRSSPAICQAVTSLRAAGEQAVHALGTTEGPPIYVLKGSTSSQRTKFEALLLEHDLNTGDAMVLAHKWRTAYSAAGRTPPDPQSSAAGNILAMACSVLRRSNATPAERLTAVRKVEALVMNLVEWPDELTTGSREEQLVALGRTGEWLRVQACNIIEALRATSVAPQFGATARKELQNSLGGLIIPHANLSARIKKPSPEVWAACATQQQEEGALLCSSVHSAKGHEYPAVLVALPSSLPKTHGRDVLDDWEDGENTERRRVLYVACSRAERILAFGAGPHADRIAHRLDADGVPMEMR